MIALFRRRKQARKTENDTFWDDFRESFWDSEMRAYPANLRRAARELDEAIAKPENPSDLPELIAMRDMDARLLTEMESQLPWTEHEQYFTFAAHVRQEALALRERFNPHAA